MKIECPHCYQHYEIERSDMDRELVCINCEQSFRVRDALVLEQTPPARQAMPWLLGGMGVLIALLLALNLWNWQRLVELRASTPSAIHAPKGSGQKPAMAARTAEKPSDAPRQETGALDSGLKELRTRNEQLTKQVEALTKTVAGLSERLAGTEKLAAAAAGAERVSSQEASLNTLAIKIEGLVAQIKLLDEYHKQLLKGLTDLRSEIQVLNIGDRLLSLEKKADETDMGPINRRIDKLEALLNAIRTVN